MCNDRTGLIPFQPLGELRGPTQAKTTQLLQCQYRTIKILITATMVNLKCDS